MNFSLLFTCLKYPIEKKKDFTIKLLQEFFLQFRLNFKIKASRLLGSTEQANLLYMEMQYFKKGIT